MTSQQRTRVVEETYQRLKEMILKEQMPQGHQVLEQAIAAAELLAGDLDVGVINGRFAKPIDADMVRRTVADGRFVVTVEEGAAMGGFGSAFIECAVQQRLDTRGIRTLALPDEFIEHGDRNELLHDHGLSPQAIAQTCREASGVESLPV